METCASVFGTGCVAQDGKIPGSSAGSPSRRGAGLVVKWPLGERLPWRFTRISFLEAHAFRIRVLPLTRGASSSDIQTHTQPPEVAERRLGAGALLRCAAPHPREP